MKALLSILLLSSLGFAEDNTTKAQHFDTLSVTATKTATRTRDISQSIAVVDRAKLDQLPMTNINDALQEIPGVLAVSKNGGYDSRLYIRGAGIKANYGIREIMILRDGFPMTDPDSFSRMDFINMEDVKQIEVTKGPGSIYASGSAGGTINIIPFSVFDNTDDRIKIGYGSFNSRKAHFKVSAKVSDKDFVSLTASHQYNEATWRNHNKFENYQTSLKYGHIFDDSSTVETELSYTKSDLELPTKLTQAEFDLYKTTGTVESTSDLFQHSARNSEVLFFSTKYEKDFDGFTFAPKIFYNGWSHFHPVTGFINDSTGNHVFGTDLQINADHTLFSKEAKLVTGLSIRNDMSIGEEKYTYLDYNGSSPTTNDTKDQLAETSDSTTLIFGGYLLETLNFTDDFKVDMSIRVENAVFNIDGNEILAYDYATDGYKTGKGAYTIDESFTLISSKIGTNLVLNRHDNLYANVSYADQVPSSSELKKNIQYYTDGQAHLVTAKSFSAEVGYKHNQEKFSFEGNVYYNPVQDYIILQKEGLFNYFYNNASRVDKFGSELQAVFRPTHAIQIGATYSFSEYKFGDYYDTTSSTDYTGNYLPHAPKYQYTLFAGYLPKEGFSAYIQSISWGEYYVDNDNLNTYEGFDFVTNLTLGYKIKNHAVKLMINNMFDQRYSVATTSDDPDLFYTPAAPINWFMNYTYSF